MSNKQWNLRTETEFIVEQYSTYILRHRGYVTYQFAVFSALIHLCHVCVRVCVCENVYIRVDSISFTCLLFKLSYLVAGHFVFVCALEYPLEIHSCISTSVLTVCLLLPHHINRPTDRPNKRTNHCQFLVAHRRKKRSVYFICIIFWRNMANTAFITSKFWII